MSVSVDQQGQVTIITIHRPERRNAVDSITARALDEAFTAFDRDPAQHLAILTGAGGSFCAGADLRAVAAGEDTARRVAPEQPGPMGPTRRQLSKPVIAAIEGHAVAGGLELACWCDLRVAAQSAVFGVFCRRFGVPLVDGGTVRLPRLIGHSHAMDMILTGRGVDAAEALQIGLVNRVVDDGHALDAACELAESIATLPQQCLRNDRRSALEQWSLGERDALAHEAQLGVATLASGEARQGAGRFVRGDGRSGRPLED
ncbi:MULTISPECIES: crotonase/enoyl-CoA hydratase family protein [unclassified Wenzhouxiangella]|uniref:crotonase/enoyl-CoA hydratase family protein n=1 Tax=unclassified Wenzhouxiangella TaxID=2613841 RepID=UPI000E326EA8|nr:MULTISPECIES: crotonase/enoyl-CoA hydratase family protein [unclassified Wenzhouxiangella]RFF26604.1 crotonase/enoyl-CoA hydratase family protein [Wenzhouxiangella sp. 15181]RFP67647.1 crotonase/enoyl-CoA hydratase family protein [Wenzhouxiangella sp. 15190]